MRHGMRPRASSLVDVKAGPKPILRTRPSSLAGPRGFEPAIQVIRSLTRNLTAQVAQAVGTVNPVATVTLSFGFIDVLLRRGKKVD